MASSPKSVGPMAIHLDCGGAAVPPVPEAKTAAACARQVKQFQIINAVNCLCDTLLITV
jgi:hypothetical protein